MLIFIFAVNVTISQQCRLTINNTFFTNTIRYQMCKKTSGIINKKHSWASWACYSFQTRLQGSPPEVPGATPKPLAPKLFIHYISLSLISPCFRSKLYPGLKRSGAQISRADRCGGVDIITVDCGTLTSQENCRSGLTSEQLISGLEDSLALLWSVNRNPRCCDRLWWQS